MGIQNFYISIGEPSYYVDPENIWGILIHEAYDSSYGPRDIRFIWSTEYGTESQKEWNFSVDVYAYGRSYSGTKVYERSHVGTYTETIAASQCNPTYPYGSGGRVWWSHRLDIGSMMSDINNGQSLWSYSWRQCDQIELHASLYSTFQHPEIMAGPYSETVYLDTSIGYCPEYELTSIAMYPQYLQIEYDTTWTRMDDRFAIENDGTYVHAFGSGSSGIYTPLVSGLYYATIASPGVIRIPRESLTTIPTGKDVTVDIRFNASYRPIDLEFAHATGTRECINATVCSDVILTVTHEGDYITISTSSAHNHQTEPDEVLVIMDGYGDQQTCALGGSVTFKYPPFGTTVGFYGIGTTEEGATSTNPDYVTASTSSCDMVMIDGPDTGDQIGVQYWPNGDGNEISLTVQRDYDTVQLAGRRRPTAGFSSGGSKKVSLSATVIGGDAKDYENMFDDNRVIYVRYPDGRRYKIAGTAKLAKITSQSGGMWNVQVDGEEVD